MDVLSKDFLISEYWRYFDTYGRHPYMKEFINTKGYPSERGYRRVWGSWAGFLKDIGVMRKDCTDGWIIHDEEVLLKHYEDKNIIPEYIMVKLNFWRSWDAIKRKASKLDLKRGGGTSIKYSHEFLLSEIRRFNSEYGQVPTHEAFANNKSFPSAKVIKSYFGTWNNAIKLAGLNVNSTRYHSRDNIIKEAQEFYKENNRSPFYNELGYSRTLTYNYWDEWNDMLLEANLPSTPKNFGVFTKDKRGNTHRSKIEASISNILIDNSYSFTTENPYNDFMTCDSNYLFDWVIRLGEKTIFVEYFGLNANWDRQEIERYKTKMHDKIQLCIDNNLPLVAINQNDLVHMFNGLVKKFGHVGIHLKVNQEHVDTIGYRIKKIQIPS